MQNPVRKHTHFHLKRANAPVMSFLANSVRTKGSLLAAVLKDKERRLVQGNGTYLTPKFPTPDHKFSFLTATHYL